MQYKIIFTSILIIIVLLVVYYTKEKKEPKTIKTQPITLPLTKKTISVSQKKKRFFALLVPAVDKVYKELQKNYLDTQELINKEPQNPKILELMKSYSAKNPQDLLMRMKPHPRSIALAQSAMESAWGTSRFFKVANNVFGVWSFNENEPRVAAGQKRGDKTIHLKKYATIDDSIKDYYKILATGKAFQKFREEKMKTDDPYELVKYLDKYSERGAEYTKELASMIRHNKLTQYDKEQ